MRTGSNRFWLGVFLLLQTIDAITTFVGLRLGLHEANAIARWLGGFLGEWAVYGWKAAAVGAFLALLYLLHGRYPHVWLAVRLSAFVLMAVVAFNVLNLVLEGAGIRA